MQLVNDEDTSYMDDVLLDHGRIRLLPAAEYSRFPRVHLQLWCHRHARYGIPTLELVEWLKARIGARSAIEIGAGNGDLGRHVGIAMTDSCIQQTPAVLAHYESIRQAPTKPPPDVRPIDAESAVATFNPQVVVASWVTHKYVGGSVGCMFGPDESRVLAHESVQTYIHIGNEGVHGRKPLLEVAHEEHRFPWVVSRSADQSKNLIYVWQK